MATIRILEGADTLREMYPKVNENFENLNNESADQQSQLNAHKTSTDHTAQNITYSGKINKPNVKEALDDAKDRIDNIVTSAGTSNTEIVDARQSTVKSKTFPNVKARFEEVENELSSQLAQIELELENKCDKVAPTEILVTTGFASGWSGYLSYRKNQEGLVSIVFNLTKNVDITNLEIIFTLPQGFRPSKSTGQLVNLFTGGTVSINNSFANIIVYESGEIRVSPVTSTTLTNARRIWMPSFHFYAGGI